MVTAGVPRYPARVLTHLVSTNAADVLDALYLEYHAGD
jgi:hypothetical protein